MLVKPTTLEELLVRLLVTVASEVPLVPISPAVAVRNRLLPATLPLPLMLVPCNVTLLPTFCNASLTVNALPFSNERLYAPAVFTGEPPFATVSPPVFATAPIIKFVAVMLPSSVESTLNAATLFEPTWIAFALLAVFVVRRTVVGFSVAVPI